MGDIFNRQSVDMGAISDVSGANAALTEVADILMTPFVVRRVLINVTTAITTPAGTAAVQWRPTPGTGTFTTIATIVLPIAAENTVLAYNLEEGTLTTTEAITAYDNSAGDQPSDASGYIIGTQQRDSADGVTVVGPGGDLQLLSDGVAGAGAIRVWFEVEKRSSVTDATTQTNWTKGSVS